jgi:hypothetical protein
MIADAWRLSAVFPSVPLCGNAVRFLDLLALDAEGEQRSDDAIGT